MKVIIAAASLLATTAMAMPALTRRTDPVSYDIKDFTTNKADGSAISSVTFNIAATNGGTLDFPCVAYDAATDAPTTSYEEAKTYACGKDSVFSWSFHSKQAADQSNQLFLWQDVGPESNFGGNTVFDDPPCRSGGGASLICTKDTTFTIELKDIV